MKLYMSGEGSNTKTFQISPGVQWEVQSNLLNYAFHTYKHRCEEMGTDHLSIPCHIPNESTNKK